MRSKLFVPGNRPELFAKALASGADAISFDLEDAVPQARKAEARANLAAFLDSPDLPVGKVIIVRTNAPSSPEFEADLAALAGRKVDVINLPKIDHAREVTVAVVAMASLLAAEQAPELLVNIETPLGLRQAADIGRAHPRVVGLQLGLGDLFEALGIDRQDPANLHAVLYTLRMAAAEAGVFAYDSAYPDVDDVSGFQAEAGIARRLGYLGKSCIHPRQIALANAIFQPSGEEVARARRIVAAAAEATRLGRGAFLLEGRMIDPPYLHRAQAIVAAADA
ncbi:HpcH/HpaI aldolase/citrate lyase family protein [Pseudoxanthomonas beigongshangi]